MSKYSRKYNLINRLGYFTELVIIISKVMTQNLIQIKTKLKQQIQSIQSQYPSKIAYKSGTFRNPLDYLQPKNYHFFTKQYISQKNGVDYHNIVYDMMEYSDLLFSQQKKMICQRKGLLNQQVLEPICKILEFYSQLTNQAALLIQKLAKGFSKISASMKKMPEKNEQQLNKRIYCHECKTEIVRNQIEKLKNDLQLRDFEDKYDFYKLDIIKLFEMRKLKNYSNMLVKSELEGQCKDFIMPEKSISLEQFEEILNLFGSDIHKTNKSLQSGIQQIHQLCKQVEEENPSSAVGQDQLREFQFFVGEKQISKKLRALFKRFYNKYNKIRVDRRKDAETQANIKQSQVIKQLQKEIKGLKMKLHKIEGQRVKQNQQSTKIIQDLKIRVSALIHQNEQNISIAESKYWQFQKRLQEQKNLIQLLRKENLRQNEKYTNLQMEYMLLAKENRNEGKNSKKKKTNTKRNTDVNVKKQITSPKALKKNSIQGEQIGKSFTENIINHEGSLSNIKSQKRLLNSLIKKSSRNTSIMSRSLPGETNQPQTQKYATYESIQQKKQQQQFDDLKRFKNNKQSRFRVFAGLPKFNNQKQYTSANISTRIRENNQINNSNIQKDQQVVDKEGSVRSSANEIITSKQYQNTLKKLYDFQTNKVQLQPLSFDEFSNNYQKFIKEINSQKEFNINGSKQSKEKSNTKEKKQNIHPSLSKTQSMKENSSKIAIKRQNSKQNNQNKKALKLQPLLRKTNYFLHKNKKNFSTYESKNTISAFASLQQSKIYNQESIEIRKKQSQQEKIKLFGKNQKDEIIQSQKIIECFGGKQKIARFYSLLHENEESILSVQENQFIMNGMTLLAQLHLADSHSYQYLKKVIINPGLWTDSDFDNYTSIEVQTSLQNALRTFLILHRDCIENMQNDKKQNCMHLQMLKSLIISFLQKQTQPTLVKKQNIKKTTQKELTKRRSKKELLRNV